MAVGEMITKGLGFRLADIPVGKSAMILASLGLTDALGEMLGNFFTKELDDKTKNDPEAFATWKEDKQKFASYGAIGLGVLVSKIAAIKSFLGADGAELIASTAIANGLNGLWDIEGAVRGMLESDEDARWRLEAQIAALNEQLKDVLKALGETKGVAGYLPSPSVPQSLGVSTFPAQTRPGVRTSVPSLNRYTPPDTNLTRTLDELIGAQSV